ncbi:hypothetical protein [Cellulomonas terrae]|uniref:hypothetical protein n=1 Tax=Cellulomonas terrae TaxID=311234 RepID=UPI0011BECEAB|nr:hypothetical protein [Cellulomonas terrae]
MDDDRRQLVMAWAGAADNADELDLATRLIEESGLPAQETASRRAGIAFLRGDAAGAMAILTDVGRADVPAGGPQHLDHVVALGARAVGGDHASFARLVAVGAAIPGAYRSMYLYVLAVTGDRLGQVGVADEAWRALAVDHGVHTPLVLSRFLAGWVAGRDTQDGNRAAVRVIEAAESLRATSPRPWEDASTTKRTADALVQRGDTAGAAMLVAAVVRTSPPQPRLAELGERIRPAASKAAVVVPFLVAAVATLAAGVLGLLAGVVLIRLVRRSWRIIPSMSLVDERAWFGLDRLQFDARKQRTTDGTTQVRGLVVLLVLVGLIAGSVAAAGLSGLGSDYWPTAPDAIAVGLWLVPLVALPVLGGVLGVRAVRLLDARAILRRDADEDRARLAGATSCRCWESSGLTGPFAAAYASVHLRPSPDPGLSTPPAGRTTVTLECPLSGVRWLSTTTESGISALLLRGTPRVASDAPTGWTGSGGYL